MKKSIRKITESLFNSACNDIANGQHVEPTLFAVGRFVDYTLPVTLEIKNPLWFEVTLRQLTTNKRPRAIILICQFYGRQISEKGGTVYRLTTPAVESTGGKILAAVVRTLNGEVACYGGIIKSKKVINQQWVKDELAAKILPDWNLSNYVFLTQF